MNKKSKPRWVDYAYHWDYVDSDQLLARIRIDGPPNDVYKDGVYITTQYWGDPIEFLASTDLSYNKESVELDYEKYLRNRASK